jgi:hypothetical protein
VSKRAKLALAPRAESTSAGDRRTACAAHRTKQSQQEIERLPFDLSALDEDGIFVNVDASGFGLLDRRIDWQSIGVTLPKDSDVAFRPPRCGVLPSRYRRPLIAPASQAHQALHKYSYQFRLTETIFETPAYRWVPWRAFSEFETAFNEAVVNLDEARQAVLADYDKIREEVLDTFTRLATDSAQRLLATGVAVPPDFRDRVTTSVLDALPGEHDLRERLTLRYQVGVILLGSEMLREQRLALEERQRIERAEAERSLTQREAEVRERVVQQGLWTARESSRQRLAAEREELAREAAVKERLRKLKLEAAREKLQETLSPLQEGAQQLRAQVYESAQAMHAALVKHGHLPGATMRRARNMAKWFRVMNFSSDEALSNLIKELELLAAGGKRKRDAGSGNVRAVLDDIIQLCYADAEAISAPSRISALEL